MFTRPNVIAPDQTARAIGSYHARAGYKWEGMGSGTTAGQGNQTVKLNPVAVVNTPGGCAPAGWHGVGAMSMWLKYVPAGMPWRFTRIAAEFPFPAGFVRIVVRGPAPTLQGTPGAPCAPPGRVDVSGPEG